MYYLIGRNNDDCYLIGNTDDDEVERISGSDLDKCDSLGINVIGYPDNIPSFSSGATDYNAVCKEIGNYVIGLYFMRNKPRRYQCTACISVYRKRDNKFLGVKDLCIVDNDYPWFSEEASHEYGVKMKIGYYDKHYHHEDSGENLERTLILVVENNKLRYDLSEWKVDRH